MSAPAIYNTGTLTADGTEQNITATSGLAGVFQLIVDLSGMGVGDTTTIRIYRDMSSLLPTQVLGPFVGAQSVPIVYSDVHSCTASDGLTFTLEQSTTGSYENYQWELLSF